LLPTHWGPPPPPLPLSSLAPQPVWISCSDPDVVAGVHERRQPTDPTEVSLKYKCQASPCVGRFLVLVYNDVWKHVLRETWEVLVHSLERIDLHALVGESTHAKISIRGSERGASGLVQCFSSAPSELRLTPEAPFALSSGSVNEIGVRLRPSTPGRQRYVVHAVELQSRKLVASWLINATQRLPAITKAFSLTVPLTLGANRKVSLTNPYTYDSRFFFRTDQPQLLAFKEAAIAIPAGESRYIGLSFVALSVSDMVASTVILRVFVNNDDDKNEECMEITVVYTDLAVQP